MKMNMKTDTISKLLGAFVLVFMAGLMVDAQQQKIADQDLLNMLENVDKKAAPPELQEEPSVVTVTATPESMDETVAETVDGDEADADVEALEDALVDDLTMNIYDDDTASSSENLISVRLNRVGLEEAINLFAQLSGANIIVPELTEAAQISVNLKDVEWRPALQSILDTYDYELYQRVSGSNVYSVRRRPAGAPEAQVVETFVLKYATVPNAAGLVRELLPEGAQVSEFASRNMIVVKSTESALSEVRSVLASIDKVRQQVFIESKFMELTDGAVKDLGIDWKSLSGYEVAGKTMAGSYGKEFSTETPSENVWKDLVDGSATFAGSGEYALLTSVLDADTFSVVLSAMENNRGVNVVSNPRVIVANEEKANISIVRKEPNLKQERQQTAGAAGGAAIDNTVFTLDPDMPFFEYGIRLDVIPSINTSSNITIQINPSLTRFVEDKEAGANTYPVIDEKSIKTVFNLSSGQTAAIGGLTEVTDTEIEHKVPVLGSIPVLGRLFSWKHTDKGQDETIIFVTVGLANTQQLEEEIGMPSDAELARRRVILDNSNRAKRDLKRQYFEAQQKDKIDEDMKDLSEQEEKRVERRDRKLEKTAQN